MAASGTHLVLIPSYNPGPKVYQTVAAARAQWTPVWVIVDGSTDGSAERLGEMAAADSGLRVEVLARNRGKGAAVLHGARLAQAAGFSHMLTMDSDGQHPVDLIGAFMAASMAAPDALILGEPQFDDSAPALRVQGRKISNWFCNLWTLWAGIHDSLFGFRVYPIAPLIAVMRRQPWMRRFDFDVEVAVRLCWRGLRPRNLLAPVHYFRSGRRRRLAFSLLARQCTPDLDARTAAARLSGAAALDAVSAAADAGLTRRPTAVRPLAAAGIPDIMPKLGREAPGLKRSIMSEQALPQATTSRTDTLELEQEIARLIIQGLNLPLEPDQIDPEAPLYGEGLGLDSIDILEIALIVSRQYGVVLRADNQENERIFHSLRHFAQYVAAHRSK